MIDQKDKLIMAPILGVTNYLYRNVYSSKFRGFDEAVTPFIATCESRRITSGYLKDVLPERNKTPLKIIPQIIGNKSSEFIILAKALHDIGYQEINWNLGCPHKRIRDKKRGSGLLFFPDLICSFLDDVMGKIPNQLSLKARLGSNQSTDLFNLLPALDQYPLERIIIHPRTGKQIYDGDVDLELFERCLGQTNHDVVYNGDIDSYPAFKMISERFSGVNQWMIGRGAIINPFLPEMIKAGSDALLPGMKGRFISFHDKLFAKYQKELFGPRHLMDKMKVAWSYWHKIVIDGEKVYQRICR